MMSTLALRPDGTGGVQLPPVMHETGRTLLDNTAELDYLTHIVIRWELRHLCACTVWTTSRSMKQLVRA